MRDSYNKFKGISFFGNISMGTLGYMKYTLSTGGTNVDLNSGTVLYLKNLQGISQITEFKVSEPILGADTQWITTIDGLRLGFSYLTFEYEFHGFINTIPVSYIGHNSETYNFYGEYTFGNLIVTAELTGMKNDADMIIGNGAPISQDRKSWKSFYTQLTYRLTDWFETGFYYSQYYRDSHSHGIDKHFRDKCLSFRFDLNPFWILKLETHLIHGNYAVTPPDNPNEHMYEEWMLYAAKLSYSF